MGIDAWVSLDKLIKDALDNALVSFSELDTQVSWEFDALSSDNFLVGVKVC